MQWLKLPKKMFVFSSFFSSFFSSCFLFFVGISIHLSSCSIIIKKKKMNAESIGKIVISGYMPYLRQIKSRFPFLQYLLNNSTLMLSLEQVDSLWFFCFFVFYSLSSFIYALFSQSHFYQVCFL